MGGCQLLLICSWYVGSFTRSCEGRWQMKSILYFSYRNISWLEMAWDHQASCSKWYSSLQTQCRSHQHWRPSSIESKHIRLGLNTLSRVQTQNINISARQIPCMEPSSSVYYLKPNAPYATLASLLVFNSASSHWNTNASVVTLSLTLPSKPAAPVSAPPPFIRLLKVQNSISPGRHRLIIHYPIIRSSSYPIIQLSGHQILWSSWPW